MAPAVPGDGGADEEPQEGALEEVDQEWLIRQLAAAGLLGEVEDDDDWEDPSGGVLREVFECCAEGQLERLQTLLDGQEQGPDLNVPGPGGDRALNLAALYGHLEVVQLLLDRGADAACVNPEDGSTALHDAAAGGYLDILKLLVPKAPELVNRADSDGDTVLHNAARGNHRDVCAYLLAHGADPKALNSTGNTPDAEADEDEVVWFLKAAAGTVNGSS